MISFDCNSFYDLDVGIDIISSLLLGTYREFFFCSTTASPILKPEASCHWGTWGTCSYPPPPPRQCGNSG